MSKYQDIKNLDALNAAIGQSGERVAAKEKQLKRAYNKARGFYTPATLVVEGSRRLVSRIPFTEIARFFVGLVRRVL